MKKNNSLQQKYTRGNLAKVKRGADSLEPLLKRIGDYYYFAGICSLSLDRHDESSMYFLRAAECMAAGKRYPWAWHCAGKAESLSYKDAARRQKARVLKDAYRAIITSISKSR